MHDLIVFAPVSSISPLFFSFFAGWTRCSCGFCNGSRQCLHSGEPHCDQSKVVKHIQWELLSRFPDPVEQDPQVDLFQPFSVFWGYLLSLESRPELGDQLSTVLGVWMRS